MSPRGTPVFRKKSLSRISGVDKKLTSAYFKDIKIPTDCMPPNWITCSGTTIRTRSVMGKTSIPRNSDGNVRKYWTENLTWWCKKLDGDSLSDQEQYI